MNKKIQSPRLLAVEGKDECNFFEYMLKHMGIEGVQLLDIGGKDKFKNEFDLLYVSPEFSDVRTLGFIRDAEDKRPMVTIQVQDIVFSSSRNARKQGIFQLTSHPENRKPLFLYMSRVPE